ncbi:hypothetical protein BLNAU_16748 [Blattamonas nauphoetae]|uniref:Uncharacterized protein n=1 Tax=Blattamonas nauphoetae TaxID=2049346 RepID=A0ABQ9XA69_9EUKA|nr:hypothetical protein BLNAU_16748 [Blattamonas nauphoetae]
MSVQTEHDTSYESRDVRHESGQSRLFSAASRVEKHYLLSGTRKSGGNDPKTIIRETRKKLANIKGNDTGMAISPLTPIYACESTEEGTVQYPAHPRRQKNHHEKQRNADLDHGAQNRGKSTQNEGKELLSPDSREAGRSMISPSISPAAHLDDVEWKKQKHPHRLQQAQAQTMNLDDVRQPLQSKPTALPVLPPLAIPFSETPPTTAKLGAHGEHHALPEIQENAKTLERREELAGQTSKREVAHTSRTHTTRTRTDSLAPHSDQPAFRRRLPNPFCHLRVAKIGSAPILNLQRELEYAKIEAECRHRRDIAATRKDQCTRLAALKEQYITKVEAARSGNPSVAERNETAAESAYEKSVESTKQSCERRIEQIIATDEKNSEALVTRMENACEYEKTKTETAIATLTEKSANTRTTKLAEAERQYNQKIAELDAKKEAASNA